MEIGLSNASVKEMCNELLALELRKTIRQKRRDELLCLQFLQRNEEGEARARRVISRAGILLNEVETFRILAKEKDERPRLSIINRGERARQLQSSQSSCMTIPGLDIIVDDSTLVVV